MAQALTYQRAQAHCGLKAGDWVQVVAQCAARANGWPESWEPGMTRMLGGWYQIEEVDPDSGMKLTGEDYYFPFFVLEKV